jgi:hypothetical protein
MKAKGLEAGVEVDGTWRAQLHPALYVRQMTQCDNTFSKENISFCFNHPCDLSMGLRSQKGRKFKIF